MNKIIFGGCLVLLYSFMTQAGQRSLTPSTSFTAATQGAVEVSLPLMSAQYASTLPRESSNLQFFPRSSSTVSDSFRRNSGDSDISTRDTDSEDADAYPEGLLFPSTPHDSPASVASYRTLSNATDLLHGPIDKIARGIPGLTDEECQKLRSRLLTNVVASALMAQKGQLVAPVLSVEHENVELTNTIDKELRKKWWCCLCCR